MILFLLNLATAAQTGGVDERCLSSLNDVPSDYNETLQSTFLLNYPALAATNSPVHAPLPNAPGRGMFGVKLLGVPALGCQHRFALAHGKTEDANKTPVIPEFTVSFTFSGLPAGLLVFAEAGLMPPIMELRGTRNLILSAALGVGREFPLYGRVADGLQLSLRGHYTSIRSTGDIATRLSESSPDVTDLYLGSTFGADFSVGMRLSTLPQMREVIVYVSAGVVDASTFFWIGDDHLVQDNLYPYFGPAFSLGVDSLWHDHLRVGLELYSAPGGASRPNPDLPPVSFGKSGSLPLTVRLRFGFETGWSE